LLILFTGSAYADSGINHNTDNGHYYETIKEGINWSDAKAATESLTNLENLGYLLTTSPAEENFQLTDIFSQDNLIATEKVVAAVQGQKLVRATQHRMQARYGTLPLSFEVNEGQADPNVKFLSRGPGYKLFLTLTEAVLTLSRPLASTAGKNVTAGKDTIIPEIAAVHMQLVGANSKPNIIGLEPLLGKVNYFHGKDPKSWNTNIPTYAKVHYEDVYPGIDLIYYGNQRQLEYDFVVSPGADTEAIQLSFEGVDELTIDDNGNLSLSAAGGAVIQHAPKVYQQVEGRQKAVSGRYVLAGNNHVRFDIAKYDKTKNLVIDPMLSYSTYLHGSSSDGDDRVGGIDVDEAGNAYVAGSTFSTSFPSANAWDNALGSLEIYVAKFNAAGDTLVYAAYLGGSERDGCGGGVSIDSAGNAYVTGYTRSTDFPVTSNAVQPTFGGGTWDAIVAKLNHSGNTLLYSTYLGGSGYDFPYSIAVDDDGNTHVAGLTDSTDFPTVNPLQPAFGGGTYDAFVAKFNTAGDELVYSTYLGGSGKEDFPDIEVDDAGNAYLGARTSSTDIPTVDPLQATNAGGIDAFVMKFNTAGDTLIYSTYLGGSGRDTINGIIVDSIGNTYMTGGTSSFDFPTVNPLQSTYAGGRDAFVAKLNMSGDALVWSTYLGGSDSEWGKGIALDSLGCVYVMGNTYSLDFPTVNPLQSDLIGGIDVFIAKFNAAGNELVYSTYLGGSHPREGGAAIAVDPMSNAYVAGLTKSTDFPTVNALLPNKGNMEDVFVSKISPVEIVNDLVIFEPDPSTYSTTSDTTGCPDGFVGNFSFDARLTNTSSDTLTNLMCQCTTLTNGNLMHNADGGPDGEGGILTIPKTGDYSDGELNPGESVDVHFEICLKEWKRFQFYVDVLGIPIVDVGTEYNIIPYLDTGYNYKVVSFGEDFGFEQPSFDDSEFSLGDGGFGTPSGFCSLNNSTDVKTTWPLHTDILLRKEFNLPLGASNLKVSVAIDNDVQVFINGIDISGGMNVHEGCPTRDSFVFAAPDGILIEGANLLAVRGRDRGTLSYLDVQVTINTD
ncbi:MAG: hypothetical protein GY727_03160, partial [Gammaproteobacteria bacterium]|nr:hypothetical protein [Gammaproteobacteria bacterium]